MRQSFSLAIAALATTAKAVSLADLCTVSNVQAALPSNGTIAGISFLSSSVTATAVYNASTAGTSSFRKRTTYSYCNVTATYTHTGQGDSVVVWYGFPDPSIFESRFLVVGGGGYSLSSGVTGGLAYGAVTGCTDAGYDAFTNSLDEVVLNANGSLNWYNIEMFSYRALGEMAVIGKAMTKSLYSIDKVYTYFSGCSDGGRQGMSQVQRWPDVYDAVAAGAPAFRQSHQQITHLFPAVVEVTQGYVPPPCALEKIVNSTIAACDPLDGRTDGVVSRTDLCQLNFNLSSIIGESYYCSAENSTSLGFGFSKRAQTSGSSSSYTPAQNGTVNAQDVEIAKTVYGGLFNSDGERAYIAWQIASELSDAEGTYNSTTGSWTYTIESTGGVFVTKFIEQIDEDNLSTLDGVTYDDLVDFMATALPKFNTTLQTTYLNISEFQANGGKLLHYHGESDPSIPAASSVHYLDAVRTFMYPGESYNASFAALSDWYKFFLIPGAAHCGTNTLQPGPWPTDLVQTIIDWVENAVEPTTLASTISSGTNAGETQNLCEWPLRPLWQGNSSTFDCVYDQASIDAWTYTFTAINETVN
ncbi:hypothetical protein SEUCBS139899_010691 [Sporothrix eucalyptigena]|uniref:Carboxylic ester hydrolase n=1 Tax=Sporothrix eucalyptigena TaxID=1812306 RepID=A0ABP0D374_9PEZI